MIMNPISTIGNAAAAAQGTTTATPTDSTKNMFLQLLVAQLQNQSPLDPVDPTQFTSQLVQFNMLDQLSQINQTLQNTFGTNTGTTTSGGTNPAVQGA
jgi:flagellar basal-body rod modification protein FlgD